MPQDMRMSTNLRLDLSMPLPGFRGVSSSFIVTCIHFIIEGSGDEDAVVISLHATKCHVWGHRPPERGLSRAYSRVCNRLTYFGPVEVFLKESEETLVSLYCINKLNLYVIMWLLTFRRFL
jgi:hypothetical protein